MSNQSSFTPQRQRLTIYIILAAVTAAVYWQVHDFAFINFDDVIYITENPMIQSGISMNGLYWAFGSKYFGLWNPLVWLSLMADYQLYGLNAGGYHITNLILHILSTLLLFWLFNRMTGAVWKSAFVAAFFALHPLHVESVAWVSERKDVLSAFFWMLTLCLYVYYTEKPVIQRYLLIVFSFVLALLSKPMVITLPVIMILLDYWPLGRFASQKGNLFLWQLKEKLPFFVLSIVFSIITISAQYKTGGRDLQFSLASRVSNALVSFMIYLEKTFWPHHLAVFYPFSAEISTMRIISAVILMSAVTAVTMTAIKRFPALFTGWAWFTITIALVIGIIPIGDFAMADRYHYLPSIGIAIMLAWGIPYFIKNGQIRKNILLPAGIMVLAVMAFFSWRQCGYWENNHKLLNHALKVTRNNYLAHINFGSVLLTEGKIHEAIYHYNSANQIMPNNIMVYNNRGKAYAGLGRYESAIQDFGEAIRLKPDHTDSYYNRGIIYHQLGRHQLAVQDFTETIRIQPDNSLAYFNRGNAYINLGRHQQAIDDFSKVILLKPDYADAYNNRAFIYLSQRRYQEAIGDYSRAITLKPDYADAYNNRAFVYLNQGDMVSGCRDAKKACELGNCSTLQAVGAKGLCR